MIFHTIPKNLNSAHVEKVINVMGKGIQAINADGKIWSVQYVIYTPARKKYGVHRGDLDQININGGAWSSLDVCDLSAVACFDNLD